MYRALTAVLVAGLLALGSALLSSDGERPTPLGDGPAALRVQVLATLPHDPTMYTQGLEIADGVLYEGSGLVGQSRVRASSLSASGSDASGSDASGSDASGSDASGSGGSSGTVLDEATLPAPLFGEGLTLAGPRLWQLTWTNGIAIERDPATLTERRRVSYQGEGWGLCHDGERLVMSDGSDRLTFRDPLTFAPVSQVGVRLGGEPVRRLNELECTGGLVWANVWRTDRILRIDPDTGTVTGVVEAGGLLSPQQRAGADVLNGIAAIPGTDEFLITGKNWPTLFRVRFVPA